jgi:hypothetical protein
MTHKQVANIHEKIETFLRSSIDTKNLYIKKISPKELLTWNRFDLAFKLFYLDIRNKNSRLARNVYEQHLKSFGLGKILEPGDSKKNSLENFIDEFTSVYDQIKHSGFDENKSLIPLDVNGSIANGAHRLSSAIHLGVEISCISTLVPQSIYDYKFFKERNISQETLDMIVCKFIEYSNNTYLAFLWPAASDGEEQVEKILPNIVYKKIINLNPNGAHNLVSEVYRGEQWLGRFADGFHGARNKVNVCFRLNRPVVVFAFQEKSLDEVLKIKEKIRSIYSIGKNSIHITDSQIESLRLSDLIFNENSIHFLNYGKPTNLNSNISRLKSIQKELRGNTDLTREVVIDGGAVLSVYSLRESEDIDYISENDFKTNGGSDYLFNNHANELKYHGIEKADLIWNPKYFFIYDRIKFVCLKQIYLMKKNRGEAKDLVDTRLIYALLQKNPIDLLAAKISQYLLYVKVKSYFFIYRILKKLGLVRFVKLILRK